MNDDDAKADADGRAAGGTQRLTMFFIVEPPAYQLMACYLAASIREQFGRAVALVGYCPAHRRGEIATNVIEVLRRMDCEVRTFDAEGRFDPPYPHGNKILASLERRDTPFSAFLDSDILFLRPGDPSRLIRAGHVSLTPAASMVWADESIWEPIYATAGLPVPAERIMLMRQRKGAPRIPYFSSGFFTFPEDHRDAQGRSFPEAWMDVARRVDVNPDIPRRRPYLDQMTLPLAIRAAGLDWNILPEDDHFILGGRLRGQPLPADREIRAVHYRNWDIVKEVGLARTAKSMLERQAGVRRISQVSLP